jgi:long-chain fatty acid transport protein
VYATAHLSKRIDLSVAETVTHGAITDAWGDMVLDGTAIGHGWNAALYAEIPGLLALGASFRSGVHLPYSGEATFKFSPGGQAALADPMIAAGLGGTFPDKTDGEVAIDLPYNMNFGLAYLGLKDWKIAFDVFAALFSSYDELDIKFQCAQDGTCTSKLNIPPIEKHWGTSWQFSLGAEHRVSDWWLVRAGYGLVTSPVPENTYDPSLPDGMRHLLCLGTGFNGSWWKLDVGYMLAMWEGEKDNDVGSGDWSETNALTNPEGRANGTYTTYSHLLALTFAGRF